jgi:DNA-binding NarL/FixJ family response regulator
MEELSIIVIDDHPFFRQGVVNALALEPEFTVVGQAATGLDAIALIKDLLPSVAIVDINLPGMNGLQVTHQVNLEKIPTRIVLLTAYDDQDQVLHAALAGAAAFCSKDVEPGRLIQTIKEVAAGRFVVREQVFNPRDFTLWLDEQMEQASHLYSEPGSPFHPLSAREMEVLSSVVRGMSNKEIASSLGISHQTVKNHITSVLRKFGVEDRTQAVVYALKHGWVTLKTPGKPPEE